MKTLLSLGEASVVERLDKTKAISYPDACGCDILVPLKDLKELESRISEIFIKKNKIAEYYISESVVLIVSRRDGKNYLLRIEKDSDSLVEKTVSIRVINNGSTILLDKYNRDSLIPMEPTRGIVFENGFLNGIEIIRIIDSE